MINIITKVYDDEYYMITKFKPDAITLEGSLGIVTKKELEEMYSDPKTVVSNFKIYKNKLFLSNNIPVDKVESAMECGLLDLTCNKDNLSKILYKHAMEGWTYKGVPLASIQFSIATGNLYIRYRDDSGEWHTKLICYYEDGIYKREIIHIVNSITGDEKELDLNACDIFSYDDVYFNFLYSTHLLSFLVFTYNFYRECEIANGFLLRQFGLYNPIKSTDSKKSTYLSTNNISIKYDRRVTTDYVENYFKVFNFKDLIRENTEKELEDILLTEFPESFVSSLLNGIKSFIVNGTVNNNYRVDYLRIKLFLNEIIYALNQIKPMAVGEKLHIDTFYKITISRLK